MGNDYNLSKKIYSQEINKKNFNKLKFIGKGAYAKVYKVSYQKTNNFFAMKKIFKPKVIKHKIIKNIINEKNILIKLSKSSTKNFISNLHFSFQDYFYLYLIIDYFPCKNLRFYINREKNFISKNQIKFLILNISLSLSFIHKHGIIHRDIKPENLIFDKEGYLNIIDFGIAKDVSFSGGYCNEISGTLNYTAPEIKKGKKHSFNVDFYSLGVVIYELMFGLLPNDILNETDFSGKNLINFIENEDRKNKFGKEIKNLVCKLLEIEMEKRIKNFEEIVECFEENSIDNYCKLIIKKEIESPFKNIIVDDEDNYNINANNINNTFNTNDFKKINDDVKKKYEDIINNEDYLKMFGNFTFIKKDDKIEIDKNIFVLKKNNVNNNFMYKKIVLKPLNLKKIPKNDDFDDNKLQKENNINIEIKNENIKNNNFNKNEENYNNKYKKFINDNIKDIIKNKKYQFFDKQKIKNNINLIKLNNKKIINHDTNNNNENNKNSESVRSRNFSNNLSLSSNRQYNNNNIIKYHKSGKLFDHFIFKSMDNEKNDLYKLFYKKNINNNNDNILNINNNRYNKNNNIKLKINNDNKFLSFKNNSNLLSLSKNNKENQNNETLVYNHKNNRNYSLSLSKANNNKSERNYNFELPIITQYNDKRSNKNYKKTSILYIMKK